MARLGSEQTTTDAAVDRSRQADNDGPTAHQRLEVPLDYCVLSASEAGQMEHHGIWPQCKHHHHVKCREAVAMMQVGTHRQVGGDDTSVKGEVTMIVANRIRIWSVQPTSRLMGLRTWGLEKTR